MHIELKKGSIMDVQEQIKNNLVKEIYTDVDKLYEFIQQHYVLHKEHHNLIIDHLNKFKDQIYLISKDSKLS